MLSESRISEIKKRKDAATTMVSALCKRSFEEGWRRWEMSIPAQPNYDPDLVISASLQDVSDLLAERENLLREREGKSEGVKLIAAERERQVAVEGWTPEHDDKHERTEMATAAICYIARGRRLAKSDRDPKLNVKWPWEQQWWKPSDDPIRNLVKAGALIAAEIDRLKRLPVAPEGK